MRGLFCYHIALHFDMLGRYGTFGTNSTPLVILTHLFLDILVIHLYDMSIIGCLEN